MMKNVYWFSHELPIVSFQILMKLEFSWRFLKNTHIPNFMKICQIWTELFHSDEQTDRHDNTNSCFLQFYNIA